MYLIDTNVISELRKGIKANVGVLDFFSLAIANKQKVYLSVVTIGELCRGIELMRHRGDVIQSSRLEIWLSKILDEYDGFILPFTSDIAQVWGRLRVPNPENELDKQIAATALVYDLCVVTRNTADFIKTGALLKNPFS